MYYIYCDEAGTGKKEPVTVVVGVIVHADRHWKAAQALLNEVISEFVPEALQPNFIFHANEVKSGHREYDAVWPEEQRWQLIEAVASIPRILKMAISLGKVRRDSEPIITFQSAHESQHLYAFWRCVARANKYVRDWSKPSELATAVAENIPEKQKFLRNVLKFGHPQYPLNENYIQLTAEERRIGEISQTHSGPIDKVIDTIHFVAKDEGPLLQIADACAWCFRRYFSQSKDGDRAVQAILGETLAWDDWQSPTSEFTFSFNPDHSYPKIDAIPV